MGESFYIRSYSGVLEPSVCQQMIGIYEKLCKEQEEEIRKMSLCYAEDGRKLCGACDCQRLDIMQHEEFKSSLDYVMQQLLPVIDQYTSDVNLQKNQWPSDYGYENLRIKRYLANEVQQHDYHSDVSNLGSTKRFLAVVCYLNDNFEGGETEFPFFNCKSSVSTGGVILFPVGWTYLHRGMPSRNGYAKYMLGTFLNYVKQQKYNRVGDKVLDTGEGIHKLA